MHTNDNKYYLLQQEFNDLAMLASSYASSEEEAALLHQQLVRHLEQLELQCSANDLNGVASILQLIGFGIDSSTDADLTETNLNILMDWTILACAYIDGQLAQEDIQGLLTSLTEISFLPPTPEEFLSAILDMLLADRVHLSSITLDESTAQQSKNSSSFSQSDHSIEDFTLFSDPPLIEITHIGITEPIESLFTDDAAADSDNLFSDDATLEVALIAVAEPVESLFTNDAVSLVVTENDSLFADNDATETKLFNEMAIEIESTVDTRQNSADSMKESVGNLTLEMIWLAPEEQELIVQAINEQLLPLVMDLGNESNPAQQNELTCQYQEQWSFIHSAFEAVNFQCILPLCADIHILLADILETKNENNIYLLGQWTMALSAYMADVNNPLAIEDLSVLLADPLWPTDYSSVQQQQIMQELACVEIGYDPRLQVQRKSLAEPEDVMLVIAGDVIPEVLDGMLRELPERACQFTEVVQQIVRSGSPEAIEVAKRIAHTLKGDGSIVGLRGIAVLTHSLEEILLLLTQTPGVPVPALANVLLDAADCLAIMSDYVLGQGEEPENALVVLQQVLDWDVALHSDEPPVLLASPPLTEIVEESVATNTDNTATPVSSHQDSITVPVTVLNQLLQMAGEAIIYSRQIETRALRLEKHIADINQDHQGLQRVVSELQQLVEVHGSQGGVSQSKSSSTLDGLDALEMEHYNELNTVTNKLVEASTDTLMTGRDIEQEIDVLKNLLVSQDRIHLELQDKMLTTLSVPVAGLIPRFQRIARQAARQVSKEIDVQIVGENTLIDHDLLHQLAEPMAHLLRNAVDHGLEDNGEREFLGKSNRGQLKLDFTNDGNQIVILCQDDGRGLNEGLIRQRGIEKGLITAEESLSTEEIYRLIFRVGFTTRDSASEISGRGIGMDIVLRAINRMKGQLSIRSTIGQGTTFEIRLPTSQIVANVTLIKTQAGWLAVSLQDVQRLLLLTQDDLVKTDSGLQVSVDGEFFAVTDAENAFMMTASADRLVQSTLPALLLRSPEHGRRVVLIEEFGESRTVIVKPLPSYLPRLAGVLGATILGDGTIAPVVNLSDALTSQTSNWMNVLDSFSTVSLPTVLVVDDSLSVRRAMSHLLEDSGFEVLLARDGLEAVAILNQRTPDIMLVDMEMPRMNGLELTAFTRNNVSSANIPVIMITSRSTERHKELAKEAGVNLVLTKPYKDEDLLDAISEQRKSRQ